MEATAPPSPPTLLYVSRKDPELRRVVLQETRSLLLDLLRRPRADGKEGWTVQDLARRLNCTTQNIHHHIKILEERGLARVAAEERTNGLARQYWVTDIAHVYTDMAPDAKAALAMDKALAHHTRAGADEGYFERHFRAMEDLGAPVPRGRRAEVEAFYRSESALFGRAFEAAQPRLAGAAERWGAGEAKSALHFAAIARFSEAEFEAWVEGLRKLRAAAAEGRAREATPVPGGSP